MKIKTQSCRCWVCEVGEAVRELERRKRRAARALRREVKAAEDCRSPRPSAK